MRQSVLEGCFEKRSRDPRRRSHAGRTLRHRENCLRIGRQKRVTDLIQLNREGFTFLCSELQRAITFVGSTISV
jgi:hypothetical protein